MLTRFKNILDIGTGTGIWAVDIADQYPAASVIGVDLSPIQPSFVPPNCSFEVDDVTLEWTYQDDFFDFIHIREMFGSIPDWDYFFEQCFRCTKPGGWVEIQEYDAWIYSEDDPELERASYVKKWLQYIDEASAKFGKRLNVAAEQKQKVINAGFINVHEDIYKVNWDEKPLFISDF